jgi:hypothetical protein
MAKPKTLEDLEKIVADGRSGLQSAEDLAALFNDTAEALSATEPPKVEPTTPITGQAPVSEPVPPDGEAGKGEPMENILELLPEKFRDKDVKSSTEKMVKSYQELEQQFQKQQEEVARLREFVESYVAPKAQAPTPPPTQPTTHPAEAKEGTDEVEFEDVDFLERPREVIPKVTDAIVKKRVQEALAQYHNYLIAEAQRQKMMEEFKRSHPDFDQYVTEMREILTERPDLNNRIDALPIIYEAAKSRRTQKIEALKAQLGLPNQQPSQTAQVAQGQQTQVPQSPLDIREQIRQALRELAQENRRRAASGVLGGSAPSTPTQRVEEVPKEQPQSEEDMIFEAMLKSGPKGLQLE